MEARVVHAYAAEPPGHGNGAALAGVLRCIAVLLLWFVLVQLAGAQTVLSPVFRFFNQVTGTHFYTLAAAERDQVLAAYPQLRL